MKPTIKPNTWLSDVVKTLNILGGKAHYRDIYFTAKTVRLARSDTWPDSAEAIIRRVLEEQSSDSESFKGQDLFYSVEGLGKGRWGLRPEYMKAEAQINTPTIREVLQKISNEYHQAKNESFTNHPLGTYVRWEVKKAFENLPGVNTKNLLIKSSVGESRWSDIPWIAFKNPMVTETTQRGYYPVYLFAADGGSIYLCMGQGVTAVKEEFKKDWKRILRDRADIIRARAPGYDKIFDDTPLDLKGSSSLAKQYEEAPAFYKKYDVKNLPAETELRDDLILMLKLYDTIFSRGGVDITEEDNSEQERGHKLNLIEKKQYKLHKKLEGRVNTKKIKEHYGYTCQVCDFNFVENYGELGEGFIEAHHLLPYSDLNEGEIRTLSIETDFAVLCANCHRMIHRMDSPADILKLRELMKKAKH